MRRLIFALVFGLSGTAILVSLSYWQVQRLAWKEARIAELEIRMAETPRDLEDYEEPERFHAVQAEGRFAGATLDVLTSRPGDGPGFRVIQRFETGNGAVLVDRGFLPEAEKGSQLASGPMLVVGHFDMPQESDSFTPSPNAERGIWFARDVETMAAALDTRPVLIVASRPTGEPSPRPMPVSITLPNNHLQYAITWGLLAVVWLAMTGLYVLGKRGKSA
ncbi:SURF1 family protein [Algicella marina]|nr:SURF1 family protein [Algicella marina]